VFPRGLTTSHGFSRAAYGGLWSYLGFCVSAFERSADKARAFEKPETIARSECIISGAKRACGHFKKKEGGLFDPSRIWSQNSFRTHAKVSLSPRWEKIS
jgi:hypothetical protein